MRQLVHLIVFLAFLHQLLAVDDETCMNVKHFTAPGFTCCNSKKFESPRTNPFKYSQSVKDCLTEEIAAEEKLVPRTWLLYKCLIQKETSDLSMDKFSEVMLKRFESDPTIQTEIKKNIDNIKKVLEEKDRRKRNADESNEESQPAETTTGGGDDANVDTTTTTSPENSETTAETTTPTNADTTGASDNNDNTETFTTTTVGTDDSSTSSMFETTTTTDENIGGDSEPEPTTAAIPVEIPIYRYLSVYEYFDKFKKYIPDEELLKSWDVYYVAEFEACHRLAGESDVKIKEFGTERCLSWLQRSTRDGECCGVAPIPMPLFERPMHSSEEIRNYTAEAILSLAGKYIWTNLTYSRNIDRCMRLSLAVMEGYITVNDLNAEIDDFISGKLKGVNYEQIVEKLTPFFYGESMRKRIKDKVLPQTSADEDNPFQDIYSAIHLDSDMEKISSFATSIYEFSVASEWDNPHENKTRYLMWTCDAYKMISQRIRYYDYEAENDCYQA